ncbi:phosphoribosylanthranilate isomerase [Snodgrassella sp. CFCC 13594]|uniref:phosphoribosylanthranilate isomerase n=1 Tax=Snodgrassella sp. CFCC 13594 TaxID=1775559 RepID=UPI00082B6312|nr:phosphoribosylanthranilate isomerase [Snodgrassella sp. CFCC 13594]
MSVIRCKVCGMTRPEDALLAADLGADAIGVIFYSGSKRYVSPAQAERVVRALPPFVTAVGLMVNMAADEIGAILQQVPLDVLQFHGDESPAFCRQFGRPYIKAVRVGAREHIQAAADAYADARALLFDAAVAGQYGGTGQTFDWQMLPEHLNSPWILSGGLNPDNITQAIVQTRAMAVDIASGVESSPGIKDAAKMAALMEGIKRAELQLPQ